MLLSSDVVCAGKCPVVIFGAGVVGEAVCNVCRERGIEVLAFCDNNSEKYGFFANIPVVSVEEAKKSFPSAVFVIAVIEMGDVVCQLENLGNIDFCAAAGFLRDYDVYQHECSRSEAFVEYVISTCICAQDFYTMPEKLFIRSVDLVITERCSLRCRDCSNLMQYYRNPVDYPLDNIKCSIKKLAMFADEINELRIIGGEPFMNRQWPQITRAVFEMDNVNRILFYTNATICPNPDDLKEFANPKTMFVITDYGNLSRNIEAMCDLLSELQINYVRTPVGGWTACAGIIPHFRRIAEQQAMFDCCCVKNSYTLANGKFYRCPFAANADQLKAVPDFKSDYVDLLDDKVGKDDVAALIRRKDYIQACRFCTGRKLDDPKIEPAIQAPQPLEYIKLR